MLGKKDNDTKTVLKDFGTDLKDSMKKEAKEWLVWFTAGAVIGGVGLGGLGLYFFGLKGLGIGLLAGAVIGGIGLLVFYLVQSSLF